MIFMTKMFHNIHKMEFVLLFFCLLRFVQTVIGDCTVDSPSEEQYKQLLEPLNGKTFNVTDATKKYKYAVKFCQPVETNVDEKFQGAGVLQYGNWKNNSDSKYVVGRITTTDIKTGSDWLFLTYKNGDPYNSHCGSEPRQAHIMLICNKDQLMTSQRLIEENADKGEDCAYIFELESSVACTGKHGSNPSKTSLSAGSIFCIIFLTVVVAYIFFGFLYNRFILGAKGMEQIPNVTFWKDFGNLEADGCDLIFRSKPPQESRTYKGLGDDQLGIDEDEERDDHLLPM